MESRFYTLAGIVASVAYWLLDSSVHLYLYGEEEFEVIPDDANELWMRGVIFVFIILFGVFADYHSRKIREAEVRFEKFLTFKSTMHATRHIHDDLIDKMRAFRREAERHEGFDRQLLVDYDRAIDEASRLLDQLGELARKDGAE